MHGLDPDENDAELIAADPRDAIAGANGAPQRFGNLAQSGVAGWMPRGVVDNFETIDVGDRDRPRTWLTIRGRGEVRELLVPSAAIENPGQGIA